MVLHQFIYPEVHIHRTSNLSYTPKFLHGCRLLASFTFTPSQLPGHHIHHAKQNRYKRSLFFIVVLHLLITHYLDTH